MNIVVISSIDAICACASSNTRLGPKKNHACALAGRRSLCCIAKMKHEHDDDNNDEEEDVSCSDLNSEA